MRRRGSIRFRLLAGALVWITLALVVAGVVLAGLFRDHVRGRVEAELSMHLDQLTAAVEAAPDGAVSVTVPLSDPRFRLPGSGLYWQVEGPGGLLLRSRSLWDAVLRLPPDAPEAGEIHWHTLPGPAEPAVIVGERSVFLPPAGDRLRIAVALDQRELTRVTAAFTRTLALSLAVLAGALVAAAAVQVHVGLIPLARLRRDLAAVRAGRRRRLDTRLPAEVMPLATDLNALLAHNEAVVGRARVQAGNLAHALKTPLSVVGNEADALEAGGAGAAEAVPTIRAQIELMRRQVEIHMARARAAASRGVPGARTPVRPCAEAIGRTLERLYRDRGVAIAIRVPDGLVFGGDRQDLEEMLGNLVENACKWTNGRIELSGRTAIGGDLVLAVDDDGPGLPPDRRAAVLARGVRLDESVPGAGLGLAVVRDLARLYGGDVRLDAAPLGGLRAELTLPAATL